MRKCEEVVRYASLPGQSFCLVSCHVTISNSLPRAHHPCVHGCSIYVYVCLPTFPASSDKTLMRTRALKFLPRHRKILAAALPMVMVWTLAPKIESAGLGSRLDRYLQVDPSEFWV